MRTSTVSSPAASPVTGTESDCRLVPGERREGGGDLERNAGAHEDVADAGEHRAVERRQGRQDDLLQQVDADRAVVAFAGEVDLDEARQNVEPQELAARLQGGAGDLGEARAGSDAAGHEVALHDPVDELAVRKAGQRAPQVAGKIAELQAAGELHVERRARDHAERAARRHGARQAPARDADPHAALNDCRMTCCVHRGLPGCVARNSARHRGDSRQTGPVPALAEQEETCYISSTSGEGNEIIRCQPGWNDRLEPESRPG